MSWAKKDAPIKACKTTNIVDQQMAATDAKCGSTTSDQREECEDYQKKLEKMSALQREILLQLASVAPRAVHSEVLREAVAPFLAARDTKGQRRELESAIAPLVGDGLVRYFCCIIDSYALSLRHAGLAADLAALAASCANSPE